MVAFTQSLGGLDEASRAERAGDQCVHQGEILFAFRRQLWRGGR